MRRHLLAPIPLSLAAALFCDAGEVKAQSPAHLGKLRFEVTGPKQAKEEFQRGVLAMHSFFYDEALEAFRASTKIDSTFVMGFWGEAMANCRLFWRQDDLAAGRAALAKIASLDKVTPIEREWIEAARKLLGDGDLGVRREAFRAAMESMFAAHPDDDEVKSFLALSILTTLDDDTEKQQLAARSRAAALAFEVHAKNPDHPGALHYIIHALDTPELAPLALPAARRYAQIAPEAFHARHMPSHIFSRIGMWKEALASCESAWRASESWVAKMKLPLDKRDYHSLHWMVEINFELGRRADAEQTMKIFEAAIASGDAKMSRWGYARVAQSYLERTGDWARVDEVLKPLEAAVATPAGAGEQAGESCGAHAAKSSPAQGAPIAELVRYTIAFTRAEAAAEAKDVSRTRKYLAEARALDEKIRPYLVGIYGNEVFPKVYQLYELDRSAVVSRALRDDRGLANILRKMAAIEETLPPPEGTAGGRVTREMLGDVLMRLDRPNEALDEYRVSLEQHPSRASSLLGAARAAVKAKDPSARGLYAKLVALWKDADPATPGLSEAKTYLEASIEPRGRRAGLTNPRAPEGADHARSAAKGTAAASAAAAAIAGSAASGSR